MHLTQQEIADLIDVPVSVVRRLQREGKIPKKPTQDEVRDAGISLDDIKGRPKIPKPEAIDDVLSRLSLSQDELTSLQEEGKIPRIITSRTLKAIERSGLETYVARRKSYRSTDTTLQTPKRQYYRTINDGVHELVGCVVALPSVIRLTIRPTQRGVVFANIGHVLYIVREDKLGVVRAVDADIPLLLEKHRSLPEAWGKAARWAKKAAKTHHTAPSVELLSVLDMHAESQGRLAKIKNSD